MNNIMIGDCQFIKTKQLSNRHNILLDIGKYIIMLIQYIIKSTIA